MAKDEFGVPLVLVVIDTMIKSAMFCTLHVLHRLACAKQAVACARVFAFVHTLHKLPCAMNGNFLHTRRVQGLWAFIRYFALQPSSEVVGSRLPPMHCDPDNRNCEPPDAISSVALENL
jgi:hypothetical protein